MASNRRHEHGESWAIVSSLTDGPKSKEELEEHIRMMMRRIGVFADPFSFRPKDGYGVDRFLTDTLDGLITDGWIRTEDHRYHITETGRKQAETVFADLAGSRESLDRLTTPKRVSFITLIVHFLLAALKLPAALISGSVGLLSDALDTLADGVASLIVHIGFRIKRERLAGIILVGFMLITGGYATSEAVSRLIAPSPASSEPIAYVAILLSALVCGVLWFYQKWAGLKNSSLTLIVQSVDSRNHVIAAAGVVSGLVANVIGFPLLDRLVGLLIALLILKSAIELTIETIKSRNEDEHGLTKFEAGGLHRFRKRQFTRWLVYRVSTGQVSSKEELETIASSALDFSTVGSLEAMGVAQPVWAARLEEETIRDAFAEGWLRDCPLKVTDKGRQLLGSITFLEAVVLRDASRSPILAVLLGAMQYVVSIAGTIVGYLLGRWVLERLLPGVPNLDFFTAGAPAFSFCWIEPTPLQLGLIAAGSVLSFIAARSRRSVSHQLRHVKTPDRSSTRRLLTDGGFARVRHPMYRSFIIGYLGFGCALHSWWSMGIAALLTLTGIANARREERSLRKQFGDAYRDYRMHVTTALFTRLEWILLALAPIVIAVVDIVSSGH